MHDPRPHSRRNPPNSRVFSAASSLDSAAPLPAAPDDGALLDFFENSAVAIHWVDPDGTILRANRAELALLGYDRAEYVGRNIAEFHVDRGVSDTILARLAAGETLHDHPARMVHKDGSLRHVLISSNALFRDGEFVHTRCFTRDVTARVEAEEDRRRRDDLYRAMVETFLDGFVVVDDKGLFTHANDSFCRIVKASKDEVVGAHFSRFVHEDRLAAAQAGFATLATAGMYEGEFPLRALDGSSVDLEWRAWGRFAPGLHLCVARDIAARKESEKSLQMWERRLQQRFDQLKGLYDLTVAMNRAAALETLYDAALDSLRRSLGAARASIVLIDPDGVMRFKAWRGLSDGYRKSVEGHSPWAADTVDPQPILMPDLEAETGLGPLLPVIRDEGIRAVGFFPLVSHGRLLGKFMLYYDAPRRLSPDDVRLAQTIAAHVAFAIDRKQKADERERLLEREKTVRAEAQAANRLKDEFLATVSHELRTPLTSILGWSRMLRAGLLDPALSSQAVETIERNAQLQARLIEDLLDVSRIITGTLRLELKPIDPVPVVEAAVEVVRPAAHAKEVRIDLDLDRRGIEVCADPARLQQIVWNLLANAIKYTPKRGRVEVGLAVTTQGMQFRVRDTGIGISPDFLPRIFDRFSQADGSSRRANPGLGLGLAIVRHLVELHGGTVTADSRGTGQGSTFTVSLPILQVQTHAAPPEVAKDAAVARPETGYPSLEGLSVLVVDDENDARAMLTHILQRCGAEVTAAGSAREALEALTNDTPHVLVSDIAMPGQDGYDLIRALRRRTTDARRIPAIALTGYARSEDRQRAIDSGFQEHLAKPIDPAEFARVVARLARGAR